MPLTYFEAVGRVLAKLREEGVQSEDMVGLAVGIAKVAAGRAPAPDDAELPF